MLGIADWDKGSATAGNRGYYLVGDGVLLNQVPKIDYCTGWESGGAKRFLHAHPAKWQALINYGIAFLSARGYVPLQTPFFMQKEAMAAVAQLAQFDDELYKARIALWSLALCSLMEGIRLETLATYLATIFDAGR